MTDKSKGGRPPAPPGLLRVTVPLRLPEWLLQWMSEQAETPAELIEAALLKAHKLRPPRGNRTMGLGSTCRVQAPQRRNLFPLRLG